MKKISGLKKLIVKQPEEKEDEVPTEIIASAIVAISQGVKKLRSGRLTDKALILLIQHAAPGKKGRFGSKPVTTTEVKAVLAGLESLAGTFLKKPIAQSKQRHHVKIRFRERPTQVVHQPRGKAGGGTQGPPI